MQLRISKFEDINQITKLYGNAINIMIRNNSKQWTTESTPIEIFTERIGHDLFVLENDDNEVVGMGIIENIIDDFFDNFIDKDRHWCTLRKITCFPGYGLELTKFLIDEALNDYEIIYIDTSSKNKQMMKIIKECEFTKIGQLPRNKNNYLNFCYSLERK